MRVSDKTTYKAHVVNVQLKTIIHSIRRSHAPRCGPHSAQCLDRSSREELHRSMAVHEWLHIGSDQVPDILMPQRNSDMHRTIT